MKPLDNSRIRIVFVGLVVCLWLTAGSLSPANVSEAIPPVADAGSSRYAGTDPVLLDGTGSYDPDNSGLLSYSWRQISGPAVEIIDANTATPVISGFIQTDEIQECEFELVVSDGEWTSLPDTVKVIIVPDFGTSTLELENPPFDPNKPTMIYFGGGNCVTGNPGQSWNVDAWNSRANVISFPSGYKPDSIHYEAWYTYYQYGDMIIVYLSRAAPDYEQPIQSMGWSTGGDPALDTGIRLNLIYADARYAVNRVTHLDAGCRVINYGWDVLVRAIDLFLTSSVNGEQCSFDTYYGTSALPHLPYQGSGLYVYLGLGHSTVRDWYRNSLIGEDMNRFNGGVVGGAFWSVVGPGKNLQLASTPDSLTYAFEWHGTVSSGYMDFYNESSHPGRLPEPVTLIGPPDGSVIDANGVVLSCEVSENAIGYQLLLGSDPHRVMDYTVVSETVEPPSELMTELPFVKTYWTVRVYDEFGSTIYADPICIYAGNVTP